MTVLLKCGFENAKDDTATTAYLYDYHFPTTFQFFNKNAGNHLTIGYTDVNALSMSHGNYLTELTSDHSITAGQTNVYYSLRHWPASLSNETGESELGAGDGDLIFLVDFSNDVTLQASNNWISLGANVINATTDTFKYCLLECSTDAATPPAVSAAIIDDGVNDVVSNATYGMAAWTDLIQVHLEYIDPNTEASLYINNVLQGAGGGVTGVCSTAADYVTGACEGYMQPNSTFAAGKGAGTMASNFDDFTANDAAGTGHWSGLPSVESCAIWRPRINS